MKKITYALPLLAVLAAVAMSTNHAYAQTDASNQVPADPMLETIQDMMNDLAESINTLNEQLAELQDMMRQPDEAGGDGSVPLPATGQVYARAEVVFDPPIRVEGIDPGVNIIQDNAMHGVVFPRMTEWIQQDVSPGYNDAPIIFRYFTLIYNAAFDAVAPYHPTAVGVYSRIEHRPASESETNLLPNIAVMYSSYRSLLELAPHRADEWRQMMVAHGLDPEIDDGLELDCGRTHVLASPATIGNHAAKCVLDARRDDGFNHFGTNTTQPFGDTTGYQPVNTPDSLNDPSRWSPLTATNRQGVFGLQEFVTPQWANTETYSGLDPRSIRMPEPISSNHENIAAYREQADEVIEVRAALTDEQKIIVEFFDNKLRELIHRPALKNINNVVDYVQLEFALNMAKFDAGTFVWQEKARYDAVRPTTAIHHIYGNELVPISKGPGVETVEVPGNQWQSYLQTADHPEYPSATTCFCAAYAQVWRHYTGTDDLVTYTDGNEIIYGYESILPAGSSLVEPGVTPSEDVRLVFNSWTHYEELCAESRVIAGTHFWPAVEESLNVCQTAGSAAFDYWETLIDGTAPVRGAAESLEPDPMLDEPFWTS